MEIADLNNLAENIARLRRDKAEVKKQSTAIEEQIQLLESQLIDMLTEADKSNWEVKGLGIFRIVKANRYKTSDKDKLLSYFLGHIDQHGNYDLRRMLSVNSNTLNAWANREEELNHTEIGVEPYIRNSISFTAKK